MVQTFIYFCSLLKVKPYSKKSKLNFKKLISKLIGFFTILISLIGNFSSLAVALPKEGIVQAGSASISHPHEEKLLIQQSTNKAIIDWRSFSINSNEHVDFQLPSSNGITLNRVTGSERSNIFGKLSSNGNLMLINPNGILFGKGSRIDVNGLVATTLDIDNKDFMSGNYFFKGASSHLGYVINQGQITVSEGGLAAFVAPGVENSGIITARLGKVNLASGTEFTLDFYGDKLINLSVEGQVLEQVIGLDGSPLISLVSNSGTISAEGGQIVMEVNAAKNVVDHVINSSGVVEAKTASVVNGEIILEGGEGAVHIAGVLDASGDQAGESGGSISVSGSAVTIDQGNLLATSQDSDGGAIDIEGTHWVSVGGEVDASGDSGGIVSVESGGLSIASSIKALGFSGKGGEVVLNTKAKSWENSSASIDVSGAEGGSISHMAEQQITTSAKYKAIGTKGEGGQIDVTAPALKFLSGEMDASGETGGGTIRLGGEYQGGKNLEIDELPNAQILSMTDATQVKASALGDHGDGGTIITWSDQGGPVLGQYLAQPGFLSGFGGFIEVSSGNTLTFGGTALTGRGDRLGTFLLDPKNITIADTTSFDQSVIIIGNGYDSLNIGSQSLDSSDNFGYSVSLDGTRVAVGSQWDDGSGNSVADSGAVYLYEFTDHSFSGGALEAIIGSGYTGGKNINQSLEANDEFGSRVSLDGNRLVVGAENDDGFGNIETDAGAVYLYSFTDSSFSGGNLEAIIGDGYTGGKNINQNLDTLDSFGFSVSLDGNSLAVGADDGDGSGNTVDGSGEVYLYSFTDSTFSGGTLEAMIGDGYTGGKNIDQSLDIGDELGTSVSLNGNRLAIGAESDDGFGLSGSNDYGAVYLYSFTDSTFSGGTLEATLGSGYTGGKNINQSLDTSDFYASDLSLDGNRLAVGSYEDDGFGLSGSNDYGAVYLYSFTDSTFSGGTLEATIGSGYTGGKNINQALETNDELGFGVSLDGNRLAVSSLGDDGFGNAVSESGAVHLFTFTDSSFSGGIQQGTLGSGYSIGKNVDQSLESSDEFGLAVSLDNTQLAVGAPTDDGSGNVESGSGAVYLYSFLDTAFSGSTLEAIIGEGYTGGKNINLSLDTNDNFGSALSLDGTSLAVGAPSDDGQGNSASGSGAVYFYTFTDSLFSNNGSATDGTGALQGIVGEGYNTRTKDIDISSQLDTGDSFGTSVSLDGTHLAVGSLNDDGFANLESVGAAYAFTFTDSVFSGGSLSAIIGEGYTGGNNFNINLDPVDGFGRSIGLDGTRLAIGASGDDGLASPGTNAGTNEGAVYLFTFTGDFTGITQQAVIGEGKTGGKNIDASTLLDNNAGLGDFFGRSLSLNGNNLAVGANSDYGQANDCPACGAVYLYQFTDSTFSNNGSATDGTGALQGIMGDGYNTRPKDINLTLDSSDTFGRSISLDGTRLAVGANLDDGFGNGVSNSGAVYLYQFSDLNFNMGPDTVGDAVFATRASEDLTLSSSTLATLLSTPQNVTLQANNDITVDSAITVDNGAGDGGNLTMQAGRSILINQNITTDNGNLNLTANETLANGVVDAERDAGNAEITMAVGTTLDAGTGDINITIADGAGKTNTAGGDITLETITSSGTLTVENSGPTAGSDIFFNQALTGLTGLTITQSDATTFNSTVNATTITLTDTDNAITFTDAVTATTLSTAAQGYSVLFNNGGTITNDTTFLNTGGVTFGDTDGDIITFTGGLDTTAGTTTARGTVNTTDTQMDIGALTLAGVTTLDSGTASTSDMNIGAITGAGNNLTLDSGPDNASDINIASVSNVGTLTIRDSGDTFFSGTTTATTVSVTDTTGAISFMGPTTLTSLVTTAQPYFVGFYDDSTVTSDTTFLNTGGVELLDDDAKTLTFTGGLDTTAGVTSSAGTINTTNTQIDIGALSLTGNTTFDSGNGAASIINIGAVTGFTNHLTLNSGTNTAADVTVASISNLGNLVITAGGDIAQVGGFGNNFDVNGTSNLTVTGSDTITLTNGGNDFTGAITLNSGTGAVSITDSTNTILAASTLGGTLTVNSAGTITDSGALAITGNSSFSTTVANQSITLDTPTNALTGAVTFNTSGTGGVTLDNGTTAVDLATSSVGQNLTITTGGAITDSGALTVGGTSSFTTDLANQSIILDTPTNALTGAVTFNTSGTGGVTLDNGTTAVDLATSSVGQNLTITTGGAITDSGALTVGGTSSFTTDLANQSITLDTATNALSGAVSFTTSGTGDASLTNNTSTTLAASTVGNALTVDATGGGSTLTVNGGAVNATSILLTADSDITLDSGTVLTASGSGNSLTIATTNNGDFINNAGAGALSAASGRWLIYSSDPATTTLGGLVPDKKRYNTTYPTIPGNFLATDNGVLYNIAPTLTITADDKARTYGDSNPALTFASSGYIDGDTAGTALTGGLTTTATSTSNVGAYPITQGTLADLLGYSISFTNGTLTVNTRPITLTADAGQTKVYGNSDPALTQTITSGSLAGSDSLTGSQARAAGENVGTYAINQGTLTVSDGNGGANYSITYVGDNFTITPRGITITADAGQTKVYGNSDPALTQTITSGSLAGGDTLTGSQARAAGEDVGTYAINQGTLTVSDGNGGANYSITYVGDNFTITTRGITITADAGQTKVYGNSDPALTQTITAGTLAGGDTLTGSQGRAAGEDVGTYAINQGTLTVSDGNGGANYSITYVGDNFTITPRGITITADAGQTKVYGNSDPALTQTITSGSLAGGDTLTGSQARAAGEDVGTYAINQGTLTVSDGNGGANYSITYVGDNFTISQRGITITADAGQTKVYGNSDPALTQTITAGTLVGGDTLTGSQARAAGENVGTYAINQGTLTVSDGNGGANYSITYVGDNFTITTRGITITADAGQTKVYGNSDPTLTQTITAGSLAGGDTLTGSQSRAAGENVGTYAINQGTLTVSDGNGGANYSITYVGDNFTITTRGITITADTGQTKVYGNSDPALTQTITSGSLAGGDTLTGSQARAAGENVGTYAINQGTLTVSDGNGGANYSITYVGDNFTITPRGITITADAGQSKVFGSSDPALTQTITSGSLAGGDTLTGSQARAAGEDVGTYAINQGTLTVSDGNGGANYSITYVGENFTITPNGITITADAGQGKVYGNSDPALTQTITSGSLVGGDTLTGSLSRAAGEDTGAYAINQGTLTVDDGNGGANYTITYVGDNFTISPRGITITADAGQTKVYGNSDPALTQTITSGTLVGGDTLTGSQARAAGENVGTYAINQGTLTVSDGNGGANYSITYVGDNFSITPRGITITADAGQTKVYGNSDPALTQTITAGSLAGGDTLTGSQARAAGENVGTYAINQGTLTVSDGNGGANYSITYVGDNFTITPRGITITADAGQAKVYGNSDPALTQTITAGSLVGGDTLTGSQARAAGEDVGTYAINQGTLSVSDGNGGANYSITYVGDNFTISQRGITITADAGQTKVYGNSDPALTQTITAGTLVGGDTLTGSQARAAGENVGTYAINQGTLTVSDGNGGANYSITYVGDNFTITPRGITITANSGQSKIVGDPDPALTFSVTAGSLAGGDSFLGSQVRALGETIGSYPISQGTLAINDGNGGANYNLIYFGDNFAIISSGPPSNLPVDPDDRTNNLLENIKNQPEETSTVNSEIINVNYNLAQMNETLIMEQLTELSLEELLDTEIGSPILNAKLFEFLESGKIVTEDILPNWMDSLVSMRLDQLQRKKIKKSENYFRRYLVYENESEEIEMECMVVSAGTSKGDRICSQEYGPNN